MAKHLSPADKALHMHLKLMVDRAMDDWLAKDPKPDARQRYYLAKRELEEFVKTKRTEGYTI